jgi:nucleoid-associated protein Lsr2
MATKTIVERVCDLTGAPADETLDFGLQGKAYTIDLTQHHADALKEILADYIKVAQPAGKLAMSSNGSKPRAAKPGSNREHLAAVRAWLRQNGHDVKDRGRLPADLVAKFDAAHASQPQQAAPSWA